MHFEVEEGRRRDKSLSPLPLVKCASRPKVFPPSKSCVDRLCYPLAKPYISRLPYASPHPLPLCLHLSSPTTTYHKYLSSPNHTTILMWLTG